MFGVVYMSTVLSVCLAAVFAYAVSTLVHFVYTRRRIRAVLMRHWPGLPDHWLYGNLRQVSRWSFDGKSGTRHARLDPKWIGFLVPT